MDTTMTGLSAQQREIVHSFIRKLRQVQSSNNGQPQTIVVMVLADETAVFWHGVPAGVTASPTPLKIDCKLT